MAELKTVARVRRPRSVQPEPEAAPDTSDPIEIALQAVAANADGHPLARAVLEGHARLLDVQCQREREEWSVLRVQRWTRWLILGAVAALLAGIAAMLWNAAHSNSLVIEPFEVPPQLAQRGITGKVVSARVLDKLADLQRKTESMRGASSYANDWQDDIKLDIPQTGVSIGEAWRTIKGWLGDQTRIGGEVTLTNEGGIAITTRAGAESAGTAAGSEKDFDKLVDQAALGLFRVTQPYRYAIGLTDSGASIAALTELSQSSVPMERKWAISGLSVSYRGLGRLHRAVAEAQRALAIDPNLLPAIGNLGHAYSGLGMLQEAADTYRRLSTAHDRFASDPQYDTRISLLNRTNSEGYLAGIMRDPANLLKGAQAFDGFGEGTSFRNVARGMRMEAAVIGHDFTEATRQMPSAEDPVTARGRELAGAQLAIFTAAAAGDPHSAVGAVPALRKALRPVQGAESASGYAELSEAAIALAGAGAGRDATMLVQGLPQRCYDCARARGWAALASGDRPGARRWFVEAIRQGPRLPAAFVDLGRLDALGGHREAALANFSKAADIAPNWADPARYEGDVLGRSGDLAGAKIAYARAAALAPKWGTLRLNQGRVLVALGDRDGARAAFAAAEAALLAPSDRAALFDARRLVNNPGDRE